MTNTIEAPANIVALRDNLAKLSERDQKFARDLIAASFSARGLSEKQAYWVDRLVERATQPKPAPVTEKVGDDLSAVVALFAKASETLKRPAIVLRHEGGEVRVQKASPHGRVPNSLNVVDPRKRAWLGRILPDGTFEHSRKNPPAASVSTVLTAFAKDPAKVASEHGHQTGCCSFCNLELSDARSLAVGYGPVCAKKWGLPWGN
jgi:hypothetical protein